MEFNFKNNEFPAMPSEYTMPEEFPSKIIEPKEQKSDSAGIRAAKRHDRIKKLMLIPLASVMVALTIVFSSFGMDPLGADVLTTGKMSVGSVTPSSSTPSTPSGTETPVNTDTGYTDSFPVLPNLNPDFSGDYAWSTMGTEEYLIIGESYLVAGSYYTNSGVTPGNISGAAYDKESNTLTLENFSGGHLDANLMGNGFKIKLVGENTLESMTIWGAMYGGSVTFTGDGKITINENKTADTALTLMCERSPSCVMIDRDATVELYGKNGSGAIMIHITTLEKAIYTLEPIELDGGVISSGAFVKEKELLTDENNNVIFDDNGQFMFKEYDVRDISEMYGENYYDNSVTNVDGSLSDHVIFSPSNK